MEQVIKKHVAKLLLLEGGEGAGKTTMCKRLAEAVPNRLVSIREPGGTWIGEIIRELLLDPKSEMVPLTEFLLFWASRAQFLIEKVVPILESGMSVMSDRGTPSTYAYQIKARGLKEYMDLFLELERGMNQIVTPHLTIFLDIDPSLGRERARKRSMPDRMEQEGMIFHKKVYEGYLEFFSTRPHVRIDASRSEEEVFAEVLATVEEIICAV